MLISLLINGTMHAWWSTPPLSLPLSTVLSLSLSINHFKNFREVKHLIFDQIYIVG